MSTMNSPNRLIHETSPYLLQHAYNPVEWWPWCEEAFEEARRRDVPVFLSSGYSSCHWCHVMERESFEDTDVARRLNETFVCIKLDREERPDVDHFYMEACMRLTGSGGWPLSIFMDHEKIPFFAGTYIPKDAKYGMTGFVPLIGRIGELWRHERAKLLQGREEIVGVLRRDPISQSVNAEKAPEAAYRQLEKSFDRENGGFGRAPKFPSVQTLLFLLRYGKLNPESGAYGMVKKTLRAMESGGIFDQICGGFFRYSTDRFWLVPHFEKMLYDNAMLLMAYGEAAAVYPDFSRTAELTVSYVFREMRGAHGGFFTALDADSIEGEGATYLWTPDEVAAVLGADDGNRFCNLFGIRAGGNFEGKSIPNRSEQMERVDITFADGCLERLMARRDRREQPGKDDKVLTSVNGLMIAALASAGRHLDRPEWIQAGADAADFILSNLVTDGRLMASWRLGASKHPGTLEDYAYLVWGLLELYFSTFSNRWLGLALVWNSRMLELFSASGGGLYQSGSDVFDIPVRQLQFMDNALPSGNGIAAVNLVRLSVLAGREDLKKHADELIAAASSELRAAPQACASLLIAQLLLDHSSELAITDGRGQDSLLRVLSGFVPFVIPAANRTERAGEQLPVILQGKEPLDGCAAAYLCDSGGCRQPVTDVDALIRLLNTK